MIDYYIGQIIEEDDNYPDAADWCEKHNATLDLVEPVTEPRQYKIVAIEPHIPTYDEVKDKRITYRQFHIDNQTLERQRKQANGTWTEEDEQAYIALDAEVTAYIEEHYPYPTEA